MRYTRKEYSRHYCNQRRIKSVLWLAEYYEKKGNEEQMVKYLERAAKRKSLEAVVKLGDYYAEKKDEEKMLKYYDKAIEMGKYEVSAIFFLS